MFAHEMKYSIIVAVYNRLDEVKELLASAEELDFDRALFEFIFVDDGSNDGFQQFIESYESHTSLNINAVYQKNQGPGAARNHGMSKSKAEFFIFVDSDCSFPSFWLSHIDKDVINHEYDAFGGSDTHREDFPPLLKAINYSMTSFIGTAGTRGNSKSIGRFYPRSFNMGIHRKIYEDIGGMNDLRHGQDMDFSARIYEAGYSVGLVENAFVYHKRRTSLPKFFRQIFNWGVARINLATIHPSMLKLVHIIPSIIYVSYVILIILSLFSVNARLLLGLAMSGHLLVCAWAFIESFFKYKSIKASFLSVITLNIQVFAYGAGILWAFWQKLLGKKEAKGFVKNYYGSKKK